MKVFYREIIEGEYRYFKMHFDNVNFTVSVERIVHYSDQDITKYNYVRSKNGIYTFICSSALRIHCYYPKNKEKEAIQLCKKQMRSMIKDVLEDLRNQYKACVNLYNSFQEQSLEVVARLDMATVYKTIYGEHHSDKYEPFSQIEDL